MEKKFKFNPLARAQSNLNFKRDPAFSFVATPHNSKQMMRQSQVNHSFYEVRRSKIQFDNNSLVIESKSSLH